MNTVYCRDLCDVFAKKSVTDAFFGSDRCIDGNPVTRIYIGSYFCGNMFLLLAKEGVLRSLAENARKFSLRMTLVIPDLAERHLAPALALVSEALEKYGDVIDELSANDIPMLVYLRRLYPDVGLASGRLINKTLRDARDADFFSGEESPKVFGAYYRALFSENRVSCVEIDNFTKSIDIPASAREPEVAVHLPFVYATTCKICEFAAVGKELPKKFRPSDTCSYECLSRAVEYTVFTNGGSVPYFKFGCGVFFKNPDLQITGAHSLRYVWNGTEEVTE